MSSSTDLYDLTDVQPGDFLNETLVTDTLCYEVIKVTPATITVRQTARGETIKSENRDGNPYPCTWTEALTDPTGRTSMVRRRKDGTYRMGQGGRALRHAILVDGKPATFTDYRF